MLIFLVTVCILYMYALISQSSTGLQFKDSVPEYSDFGLLNQSALPRLTPLTLGQLPGIREQDETH